LAVTPSARIGITRWSVDGDPVTREQFDGDHARLDSIIDAVLTTAQRDALVAADKWPGRTIYNSTKLTRELWNGAAWIVLDTHLSLTTAERDALAAAAKWVGRIIHNTTTGLPEVWNGSAWVAVGQMPSAYAQVLTSETSTAHNTWGDLPTVGPAVTVTPITGKLKITIGAYLGSSYNFGGAYMSVALSGGNVLAPGGERVLGILTGTQSNPSLQASRVFYLSGLALASTTITAKYSGYLGGGAVNWFATDRQLLVEHVL
jgi:hypothetical protein